MTDLSDKKVLILGAGRGQRGLYLAARKLGITTIAGTMLEPAPLYLPLADEVCEMNIMNPDEVEAKTMDLSFDGVATCCLDKGLKALGRLVDKRNLAGFAESAAEECNNKLMMKKKFREHNVPSAPFLEIQEEGKIEESVGLLGGYPVIIKATDLAGSRGIYKANNYHEALAGFRRAITETDKPYLIIEKFITGNEFGAQAFVQNGKILFIMPHGDILYQAKTNVPVGHYVPYTVEENLNTKICQAAEKAIRALGLDNCAVNIDFIEEDGEVYVLELSGRIGANGLPEMVSAYFNIDYYEMVLLASLGIDVNEVWQKHKTSGAVISRMLFSEANEGTLKELSYEGEYSEFLADMQLFAKLGSVVHKFENSSHCLGQFTVKAPTLDIARQVVEKIEEQINIVVK